MSDFWPRVLAANGNTDKVISDKDRPILGYVSNVEACLHTEDHGFTVNMFFDENQYMEVNELSVSFFMQKQNVVERIEGTEITWKAGCDPTHMKKTKKKKGKKITENKKVPSFFDLFASHVAKEGDNDEDSDDETAQQMDEALDLGNEIKDSIVPLALEQYLGVIEVGADDSEDDDDDDDDDEDEAPAKGGKPLGGKGGNADAPKGKDGKECK